MSAQQAVLEILASRPCCGYEADHSPFTEPTALAALALSACGRHGDARRPLEWLAEVQSKDGSLGVSAEQPIPAWPTSLAVLAWANAQPESPALTGRLDAAMSHAIDWLLGAQGETFARHKDMGHDPTLIGWPWVEGTHAWVEPTSLHLLALRSQGMSQHARARQAVAVLVDRLLPEGGSNYGNTTVLGQTLRPHILPTSLSLLALAGEADLWDRIAPSVRYLERTLSAQTTVVSLCYGLMALAAYGREPSESVDWLSAKTEVELSRQQRPMHLALLLLADLAQQSPLVAIARGAH